ncbi:MAG: hypothetical protein IJ451_05610 [Ruminococcus sp.]|nr:hypothetical protein [Ruminococcus sp.]
MDNKKSKNKKGSKLLKIVVLVVVLALVGVGSIILSDVFFSDDTQSPETETITIRVSDKDIYLNGSDKTSLDALDAYLTERFDKNDYCTVALINDTQTPADTDTYNLVVELLGKFGIKQDRLTLPATDDEL